ncbi:MAG TPA: M10 family metallopeptidase [Allosphingosinicella sp.]|nr:M10 family metallopeptidase [Allosphingosinicella sp.]
MKTKNINETVADLEVTVGDIAAVSGPIADATDFNATFPEPGTGPGLPDLAEPGETIRGKPVLPLGENVPGTVNWQIDSGRAQDVSDNVITFGFLSQKHATGLNNNPYYGEGRGYSEMTAAQKAAARLAVNNWDELIAAQFVEAPAQKGSSAWAQNAADIWLANTYTGPAQAWAYYPGSSNSGTRVSGDVWVADPRFNGSNNDLFAGGYGLQTLNHELGHSLGLSHPGDYNFGDDQDGDGEPDPITYEGDAFYFQDSNQYTIMSYFDAFETGSDQIDWNLMRFIYPSTPMVHDIAVIQNKYGADMTTRTGDTTYGFNATADVTNPAMSFVSNERLTMFSIWDAGGNDTLDLSGYNSNSVIDLRPGAYTSAGGPGEQLTLAQINANNAAAGLGSRTAAYDLYFGGREGANEGIPWSEIVDTDFVMDNNIGIAYGAIIENAIGGGGDDQINGNSANNSLTGNGGDDTFVFADDSSTDTITDFDSGNDVIDLSELGADAGDVTFGDHEIFVTTADHVVHIVSGGDQILMSDIYFG